MSEDTAAAEETGTQGEGTAAAGGAEAGNWLDQVTDADARALVETKKYGSVNDVAVAYRNMVKLHGRAPDVVGLPESDDDEDGWNTVYARLGRPDSPDNYGYEPPEGVTPNEDFVKSMREAAHKAGISNKQFQALAAANDSFFQQMTEAAQSQQEAAAKETLAKLAQDFGGEQHLKAAQEAGHRAVKAIGLDEDTLDQIDAALGSPAAIKLLATLGQKIGKEADFIEGIDQEGHGQSAAAAKAELDRLQMDAEFQTSLLTPSHASHKANVARWSELQRVAFSKKRA